MFIAFLNSNKEELRLKSQELIRQKLSEIVNPFLDQSNKQKSFVLNFKFVFLKC